MSTTQSEKDSNSVDENKSYQQTTNIIKELEQNAKSIDEQAQKIRDEENRIQSNIQKHQEHEKEFRAAMTKVENKDNDKNYYMDAIASIRSRTTILSVACLLIIAGLSYSSYEMYKRIELMKDSIESTKALEAQITRYEDVVNRSSMDIDRLLAERNSLISLNAKLNDNVDLLEEKVSAYSKLQELSFRSLSQTNKRLDAFEDQDPNIWKKIKAYFLVSDAYQELLRSENVELSKLLLQNADDILASVKDEKTDVIRSLIVKDISTLNQYVEKDYRGIHFTLDALYQNIDKLKLNGYIEKAVENKEEQKSAELKDWKQNLLISLSDFSKKFIEIKRKADSSADVFLTPKQDSYLRENIKSRILMAQIALDKKDEALFEHHLNIVKKNIEDYFIQDSQISKSVLETINNLIASDITSSKPRILESYEPFNQYYNKFLAK